MMEETESKNNLRQHKRTPLTMSVRYSAVALTFREVKDISDTAVSFNLSYGGLCIVTGYPLEKGNVVIFEDEIEMNNIKAKFAVVRWANKVEGNKYQVGLKFIYPSCQGKGES